MAAPLLHVGYHKTGTTWLQRELFRREDRGFGFVSLSKKRSDFVRVHDLDFDAQKYREELGPEIARAQAAGHVPVISAERLSGNPHSGGFDNAALAGRLQRVFPDARVFAAIREQRAMILSSYAQYVKAGGACSLRDYVRPCRDHRLPLFRLEHFRYDRLVAHYQRLFGAERVLVLPYEMLVEAPREYVGAIAAFAGAALPEALAFEQRRNPSLGPVALAAKRRLNPFAVRDSLNANSPLALPGMRGAARALARVVDRLALRALDARVRRAWWRYLEAETEGFYDESNQRTAALTGLDLARWGYPMSSRSA